MWLAVNQTAAFRPARCPHNGLVGGSNPSGPTIALQQFETTQNAPHFRVWRRFGAHTLVSGCEDAQLSRPKPSFTLT